MSNSVAYRVLINLEINSYFLFSLYVVLRLRNRIAPSDINTSNKSILCVILLHISSDTKLNKILVGNDYFVNCNVTYGSMEPIRFKDIYLLIHQQKFSIIHSFRYTASNTGSGLCT